MAEPISIQQLKDASLDVKSLEEVVNGDENVVVATRLGETYPSVKGSIKKLFENGGLPATPFKTKALMTASASDDGDYAQVTDDSVAANNGLYVKTAGAWVKSDYDPMSQINKVIEGDVDRADVFQFVDTRGYIGARIDSLGNINASNIGYSDIDGLAFAFEDSEGNIALSISDTGKVHFSELDELTAEVEHLKNTPTDPTPVTETVVKPAISFKSDIMHVLGYGQSLSRGFNSKPPISTSQPYSNITVLSGVGTKPYDDIPDYSDFKPLVAQVSTNGMEGETPVVATCNIFVERRVTKGDDHGRWQMLGTCTGRGSSTVLDLSLGGASAVYEGTIQQIQACYDTAHAKGETYSVWAITWAQGEHDTQEKTTLADYYSRTLQLYQKFAVDIEAITNQNHLPPFIMYQTGTHRKYSNTTLDVAQAQLNLSENEDRMMIATPTYFFDFSDGVHLQSESSAWLGGYFAKALNYFYETGEKYEPLKPVHIIKQGRFIDIVYNKKGLVFDTNRVALAENYGFDVWDSEDNLLASDIESVAITDSDRVRITLISPESQASSLTYARGRDTTTGTGRTGGSRGNLRDVEGDNDTMTNPTGGTLPLHNWCVHFHKHLAV